MFGINGGEFVVLLLLAAVVIGPERLPRYAEQLAHWVRTWRATLTTTKQRLSAELGEDDVDWTALDPRRYDPRRIVRDALLEPDGREGRDRPDGRERTGAPRAGGARAGSPRAGGGVAWAGDGATGAAPPFDDDAT